MQLEKQQSKKTAEWRMFDNVELMSKLFHSLQNICSNNILK